MNKSSGIGFLIFVIGLYIYLGMTYGFADPSVTTAPNDALGFLAGFWHGAILLISFFCSLFWDTIVIYAPNNSGGWYDFGFLVGLGGISYTYTSK